MHYLRHWAAGWMMATWLILASGVAAQEAGEPAAKPFTEEQVEQLVAPIALYPDALVAQVLMASTYPLEIVRAARWMEGHADLTGDALDEALDAEDWDPSVKSLTHFPDVLKRMSDNLDWTQDLGDAVRVQQADVMDTIQRMRRYAYDQGNLQTTPEQKVVVEERIIKVEPTTEVIYVPAYNPTVVYGTAWSPISYYYPVYRYPPTYWYPPGYAASNVISFGVGLVIGAAIWGDCDWHHHHFRYRPSHYHRGGDININIDRSRNYYNWEHNPKHREGVRYRDASTRKKFDNSKIEGGRQPRIDRDTARGFDRSASRDIKRPETRDIQRPATRDIEKRPETRDIRRPATQDIERPETRDTQRPATRDMEKRPETRDIQRPATRDIEKRPETRDIQRPATGAIKRPESRDIQRPATQDIKRDRAAKPSGTSRQASKSSAFQMDKGGMDRAASKRGASSRSGSASGGARSGGRRRQ